MSDTYAIRWTPDDHAAGTAVLGYVWNRRPSGRVTLTTHDLFRAVFVGLWEAESGLYLAGRQVGIVGGGVGPEAKMIPPAVVGGGERMAADTLITQRYGRSVMLFYSAMGWSTRAVVRASLASNASQPEYGGTLGPVDIVQGAEGARSPLYGGKSIAPVAALLLGVLGLGAMAAGSYIAKSYFDATATVDAEKVRVHAELSLKQQALNAQLAAGQVPKLDDLTISAGEKGLASSSLAAGVFAGLGLAALAGYGLVRLRGKEPNK